MQIQTTTKLAVELASSLKDNKLLLQGNKPDLGLIDGVYYTELSDNNLFSKIFPLDTHFFYHASIVCRQRCEFSEVGIAHLEENDGQYTMCRDRPMFSVYDGSLHTCRNFSNLDCPHDDEYIVVTSYTPTSLPELLHSDNHIIFSNEECVPASLEIEKNSLIVRLNDNIQSITFDSLAKVKDFTQALTDCLSNYTKQIALKASRLDVKALLTKSLLFTPTKTPLQKKGELYFDDTDNKLKFFDGTEWRCLKYEDTQEHD